AAFVEARHRPFRRVRRPPVAGERVRDQRDRAHVDPVNRVLPAVEHHGTSLPGFMMPAGSTAFLMPRSTATPTSPISSARYGRWSLPTAWWCVIVAPLSTMARHAASFAVAHWARGSSVCAPTTVKYSDAPVSYTWLMWHSTEDGAGASAPVTASPTAVWSFPTFDQSVAVSRVSQMAPASSSASRSTGAPKRPCSQASAGAAPADSPPWA